MSVELRSDLNIASNYSVIDYNTLSVGRLRLRGRLEGVTSMGRVRVGSNEEAALVDL
jgi:hypothetical protein